MRKRKTTTHTTTITTTTKAITVTTTGTIDPKRIEAAIRLVEGIPTDVLLELPTWLIGGALKHLYAPGDAQAAEWDARIKAATTTKRAV